MFDVLLRACSFAMIIVIGIGLRSSGLMGKEAGEAVKKLLIYLTLPAVIIVNFSAMDRLPGELTALVVLGLVFNLVMIVLGAVMTRKRSGGDRALYMLGLPAYNIGAFAFPFVQSFLPSLGVISASLFDVGNSIMCTGGTYAFVSEYASGESGRFDVKNSLRRLISSPPLVTYVVMYVLAVLDIRLPGPLVTLIDPIAKANIFVAMMMLGLLFHLELKREYLKEVFTILVIRHVFAAGTALFCYFVLPFDLVVRQALVLVCFAPMSAMAPAYTGMCGGDEGMSSCANSISIVCSLAAITVLVVLMGLS